MSIDHGKVLALCDVPGMPDQWDATDGYMHGWNDCLRALAQPAEAVEGADAFDHDAALAEWRRLEGHQPDAVRMRAAISASIPASINEAAQDADDYWRDMYRIERAMRFMDGGMSREGAFTAVDKEMAHGGARGARRDAAQGAVATVCLVGERYAHGHMVSVELQLAGEDAPAPKIGDRYYTHPQAAPAQGDGWKLVPVEATMEMLTAGAVARAKDAGEDHYDDAKLIYEAMIAAAPSQEGES